MHARANFTRNEMATALRKGPYQVNLLLGSVDPDTKQSPLYFLDYLAALQKVPYGSQGYTSNFCSSIFDRESKSKEDTTYEKALEMVQMFIKEMHARFLISQPNFILKVIDANGFWVVSHGADPADD